MKVYLVIAPNADLRDGMVVKPGVQAVYKRRAEAELIAEAATQEHYGTGVWTVQIEKVR